MSMHQNFAPDRRGQKNLKPRRTPPLLNLEHLEDRLAPSANSNFVSNLYKDLLNRAPDAGGLTAWTATLDQGTLTRTQVALDIEYSPEYMNILVANAYGALLNRAPDAGGQQAWVMYLQEGHTQSQLYASIASSPEYFQTRGGNTNSGFVTALYEDALNRAPDAGGAAFWEGQLAAGDWRPRSRWASSRARNSMGTWSKAITRTS